MKNIVAISGSLRKESFNTKCLAYIGNILSEKVNYEILDISEVPLFNEDIENNKPIIIENLLTKIEAADLLIISTPEYNYSVSGVLKNTLDWFSRSDKKVFLNKKVAIISASLSRFGGVRAQNHLRQILLCLGAKTMLTPEVFIANVNGLFKEGKLADERTILQLNKFVESAIK